MAVPLVQAAQNVVPVAVTVGDKIEGLRQWASGRCLLADRAGVYSRAEGGGRVRRVVREPEQISAEITCPLFDVPEHELSKPQAAVGCEHIELPELHGGQPPSP